MEYWNCYEPFCGEGLESAVSIFWSWLEGAVKRLIECCLDRPNQVHKKAIEVDAHLRVKGAPAGTVYAIGDASTVSGTLHILLSQN